MGKAPRYLSWEWRSLAAGSRGSPNRREELRPLDADTPEQTPSKEELPPFLAEKDRSGPMNGARGMFFWEHGGPLR